MRHPSRRSSRILYGLLAALGLAVLACSQATVPPTPTPAALRPVAPPPGPFVIGVEYGIPGLAAAYAESGVVSVKLRPEFGKWGNLENVPGAVYWGTLDSLVREFQHAGFTDVQILLMADSPWASVDPPTVRPLNRGNTLPAADHFAAYGEFVRQVVERYDHDGQDDMPDLLYPVNRYAVEAEFTGFWPGSADDYMRLLRQAYPVIHNANPDAEVALVALLMVDAFSGATSVDEADRRLNQPFSGRKTKAEIELILGACDAYDVVDFHSLGDYTEIPLTAAWIRERLAELGCDGKGIIIGDAFSMSGLLGYVFSTFHPATEAQRPALVDRLEALADPGSAEFRQSEAWLRAEMARNVVRKIVVAAASGVRAINIGNFEDWRSGVPAADKLLVPAIGTAQFMGLRDTTKTNQYAGAPLPYTSAEFSRINRAGSPRPAFSALQLAQARLGAHTAVTTHALGDGIWAYAFTTPDGPQWVLWYDDGQLYLPGETAPTVTIDWPFPFAAAEVTETPTIIGRTTPLTTTATGPTFTLGPTPVFVTPAGP